MATSRRQSMKDLILASAENLDVEDVRARLVRALAKTGPVAMGYSIWSSRGRDVVYIDNSKFGSESAEDCIAFSRTPRACHVPVPPDDAHASGS